VAILNGTKQIQKILVDLVVVLVLSLLDFAFYFVEGSVDIDGRQVKFRTGLVLEVGSG
jgi:hypothetical protein